MGADMNPLVFFSTPLSAGLLILSVILVVWMQKKSKATCAI